MNTPFISSVIAVVMTIGLTARPAVAQGNKHSVEHNAAVKKCGEAYEAGVKAAHAPGSPTGAARKRTMHRLAEEKKACIARAPK